MDQYRDKFQQLLRELFQFDCADLDFGIYRIMNHKRDVIERFITQDLPKAITEELDSGALADQIQAADELKEVARQIKETLGKDALDADGNIAKPYGETPLGRKYLDLKARAAGGRGREALEAGIFNHLFSFFSRYYQDGDFISKRRYSRRQKYAIPYNGEEVYLYWANNDQYYVKTAEYFHDYTFSSRGVTVHFKLLAASVEQNNIKGDKRFFLPRAKKTEWDEGNGRLIIPFEYRPLTEQEEIAYGKKNQQETIIAEILAEIPKRLKKADRALEAVMAEHHKNSDGRPVTFLEHYLRQYTQRNTSDFFIHKDLKGFLSRELDFYLKNEVLNLDEMERAGEDRAEGWFQITRAIKVVGGRIIDFLDQVERFQKMLWEKRKFITETQYCITVANIGEGFYDDIAACEAQWTEWKELFHIDEEQTNLFNSGKDKKGKRIAFLGGHPTLVLDTKYFDAVFVDKLLASIDDLDGEIDGLLIHSENFQALSLLLEKYREKVKCIYIDPPYNTGDDGFLFRDAYKHSSWLSLLYDRIVNAHNLMSFDALNLLSVDDIELRHAFMLMNAIYGEDNFIDNIIWKKRYGGGAKEKYLVSLHEYVLCFAKSKIHLSNIYIPISEESVERYYKQKDENYEKWGPYRTHPLEATKSMGARPNLVYDIPAPDGSMVSPKRQWLWSRERTFDALEKGALEFIRTSEGWTVHTKQYLNQENGEQRQSKAFSIIDDVYTQHGTNELLGLFADAQAFPFPKPSGLIKRLAGIATGKDSLLLDFFAGSGSSAHAVINLNREDGGNRRSILVEMGQYFDTVLLPRIKKITFAPEWKDGKPKRMATQEEANRSPRIVKYIRLESYEDALNNIEFDDASGQQAMKFDDYLIKYMLKWETRASETLLNVEKLARPFSYKLHIHADGQTREKVVDIPETFNYLLGLHVRTRRVHDDDGRRYLVYTGRIAHRHVVVIWRETEGWQKADLERDKKFVAEQKLPEGADEVFVNGDSFIPKAKALEPVFKARMFAGVES